MMNKAGHGDPKNFEVFFKVFAKFIHNLIIFINFFSKSISSMFELLFATFWKSKVYMYPKMEWHGGFLVRNLFKVL